MPKWKGPPSTALVSFAMADMAEVASSASTTTTTAAAAAGAHRLIARKMLAIDKFRKSIAFKRRRLDQKKAKLAKDSLAIDKAAKALRKRRAKAKQLRYELNKQERDFPALEVSLFSLAQELDEDKLELEQELKFHFKEQVPPLTRAACWIPSPTLPPLDPPHPTRLAL